MSSSIVSLSNRTLAVLLLLGACSCAKNINTKEAVREAVVKRIAARGDMSMTSMEIEIANVSFQGKTAEANVAFKGKGSAEAMMNVSYKLEREGDAWVVKSTGAGGGEGAPPSGHAGAEQGGAGAKK